MNKLLLSSLSLFFLAQAIEITKHEGLFVHGKLGAELLKVKEFEVLKDNESFKVHDMHPMLHTLHHDTINNDMRGSQQSITQTWTMITASFWLSKLAVHAAAQIVYAVAAGVTALVYPPAAPVVYYSLQLTFAVPVEIASNMIAGGTIALGGATSFV